MGLFSRKKQDPVLAVMDGREVKYVTRRHATENGPREEILGKNGRIVCLNGEIRVMCETVDVFRCESEKAQYFILLSGDGVTISGVNRLTGQPDEITAYYKYYRK